MNRKLVGNLSPAQVNDLRQAFALFDTDGYGSISAKELGTIMRSLGHKPTESQLRDLIHQVDVDRNGTIEFDEFLVLMAKQVSNVDPEDDIMEAFRVFDRDKNGFVTAAELRYVMTNLGERISYEEAMDIIRELDFDEDGQLNYEEFHALMTR